VKLFGSVGLWAAFVLASAALPARANGPIGDAPVFTRIEALRPVAQALVIDGNGADWGAIPSFADPTGDAAGDPSRDITSVAIAPLADSLAVRITTAGPPSTYDLSFWLDIDFMGQAPLDVEIGLYNGFDDILWIYPETGSPTFQYWHDSELAIGNVVEARIPYAALAAALPADMAAALTGPNPRPWLRVTAFTVDYSQASVPRIDTGPAVSSYRLVPTPYNLDAAPPAGADPNIPPLAMPMALSGLWQVIQGPYGVFSHAGYWGYDFAIMDTSGLPDVNDPSSNNADYYDFGQPVRTPLAGSVYSLVDGNPDGVPNTPAGAANFVYQDIGNNTAVLFTHLKQGSVAVSQGQSLTPGVQVGQVGNSGSGAFPHLHLGAETIGVGAPGLPIAHTEVEVGLNPVSADPWLRWLPNWPLREGYYVRPAGALCGDTVVDQVLNGSDVTALRGALANPGGSPLSSDGVKRCTVIGSDRACDVRDAVVIRRKLASPSRPPGIAQVCAAALGT
jgi:peptidase M23-like protein